VGVDDPIRRSRLVRELPIHPNEMVPLQIDLATGPDGTCPCW